MSLSKSAVRDTTRVIESKLPQRDLFLVRELIFSFEMKTFLSETPSAVRSHHALLFIIRLLFTLVTARETIL